ncbi:hypothetical protein CYFUS_006687 [Cystobacter fuscus]|uniref:Uncharacterized protein n=1 Tax=Cystobacter fuscus TaxID=43 RepID=A0A250JCM0_9BACT|nr:DUF5953 family protein [Cystobacter fuscus]ATB41222.1 hypothetical protein CYFUS_006687 [Cystobacter fuscus]
MMKNTLNIKVYAPALVSDGKRPLAIVHGLERTLPGIRLEWTISEDRQLVALPHRDAWLAQAIRRGGFPIICNNDESHPVTIFGLESPAETGPGGHALLDVDAQLPLDAAGITAAVDVLEGVSEGARAYWGHATPFRAGVEISRQTRDPVRKPGVPPRELPVLKLPEDIRSPEIPHCLGWLNYWSAAAAEAIGFPDPARDAELLSRARRTATGGWVVRLTDEPLDLDNPAHLDALKRAYERFPEIGGRAVS